MEKLYTAEEILKKTIDNLMGNIEIRERDVITLQGEIGAMQTILANVRHWQNAEKSIK